MGSGKGHINHWVSKIKPGIVLFEISKIINIEINNLLKNIQYKLPVKTKILIKL